MHAVDGLLGGQNRGVLILDALLGVEHLNLSGASRTHKSHRGLILSLEQAAGVLKILHGVTGLLVGDHQLLGLGHQPRLGLVVTDLLHLRILKQIVRGLGQRISLHVQGCPHGVVVRVPGLIPQILGRVHGLLIYIVQRLAAHIVVGLPVAADHGVVLVNQVGQLAVLHHVIPQGRPFVLAVGELRT